MHRLRGKIVDESNEALREAEVMLFRREVQDGKEATTFFSNAQVNDEGHYRFSHLGPGTYFVAVRSSPWYAQNAAQPRPPMVLQDRLSASPEPLIFMWLTMFFEPEMSSPSAWPKK